MNVLCQLCVLSFRVELKAEKDTKVVPSKWYSEVNYKVMTQKVGQNIFKQNTKVTTALLNSDNVKVAITQLCNGLQVCNFTML